MADLRSLSFDPDPNFVAGPLEDDMFTWHFTIRGAQGTPFEEGLYHGKILFPTDYPIKPPDIFFLTPNGRFEVNKQICLNTTSYHPESWQPSWDVRTLLTALIAFLPTKAEGAIGAIDMSDNERRQLARQSRTWYCPICNYNLAEKTESNDNLKDDHFMSQEEIINENTNTNSTLTDVNRECDHVVNITNLQNESDQLEPVKSTQKQRKSPFANISNMIVNISLFFIILGLVSVQTLFILN